MRPHPRIRKTIKWGGLALCLLLAGVWVRSEFATELWVASKWAALWHCGKVGVMPGSEVNRFRGYLRIWDDGPNFRSWWCTFTQRPEGWWVTIPLWMPLAPTLLATAAAWRLDALARRRARAGVCAKCGYDRAGLAASAVCPECGAAASS